ncbi:MAG: ribonuclease J [Deltaproteobacteria bacterium]
MNCYVYGYGPKNKERLIVVDVGVTFGDMDSSPGVDLIMADIAWLKQRNDLIDAIFITHAHEDHIGALQHLWPDLKAKVYARKFTAAIGENKLGEAGLSTKILKVVGAYPEQVKAGPFTVSFLPISHSIPESAGLVIDTPAGRVIHTGDFKLDATPGVGEAWDPVLWGEVSKGGVKALVCDSTNVHVQRPGRSEATIIEPISALIKSATGLVAATTFASNVARLKTLATAAQMAGRSVVLLGRAMNTMVETALRTGVVTDFPRVLSPEEASDVPRDHLMILATGSQGERRAAIAQLSRGKFLGFELSDGDTVLYSSRVIPGNDKFVIKIMNAFSEKGVTVVEDHDGSYHVSGHANGPDLETMHQVVKPTMLIPMHGDHRMLSTHKALAEKQGIASIIATNGTMLDLTGDTPKVVDQIDTGRTYLDGKVLIGAMDGVIRDRIRLALNGIVIVTTIIDERGRPLGDPWCDVMGLPEIGRSNAPLIEVLEEDLSQFMGRAERKTLADDDKLEEALSQVARKSAEAEIGRKPEVLVVVSRLQ